MTARIFISYRSSDGIDKATALARELNALFGDEQVFLDKEDLPAGLPWREAVGDTLDAKPVLLLVVTPQTFGERIADPNDPVRREITAALGFGAHVIPLLGDGVEALPDAASLPEPLRALGERTWRRLRAYDWHEDFGRLVHDLEQLGVKRLTAEVPRRKSDHRRRALELGTAFCAGALASGVGGMLFRIERQPQASNVQSALSGAWTLRAARPAKPNGVSLDAVALQLTQSGEALTLTSEPIDITQDPAWADFAQHWQRLAGFKLERLVLRGSGKAQLETGAPAAIDLRLRMEMFTALGAPSGGDPIETGNLSAAASADGRRLVGRVWLNGEQAERAVELVRRGH